MWQCASQWLLTLYLELNYSDVYTAGSDSVTTLQIAAIMHDSVRRSDKGQDYWDEESAHQCKTVLLELGCSVEDAKKYSDVIRYKDTPYESKNFLQRVMHDADAIDRQRVRSMLPTHRFDIINLDIYQYVIQKTNLTPELQKKYIDKIIEFVLLVRALLFSHHDMKYPSAVYFNGKQISDFALGNRDETIKAQYDHAPNCYQKILAGLDKRLKHLHDTFFSPIPNENLKIEQLSSQSDAQYFSEKMYVGLLKSDPRLMVTKVCLSPSSNLHCYIKSKNNENIDVAAIIKKNHPWISSVKCLEPSEGRYSIPHADVLKLMSHLSIHPSRFECLINDRLHALNPEGCIFITDEKTIFAFGPNDKEPTTFDLNHLKKLLIDTKSSNFLVTFGKTPIHPEKLINLIKGTAADNAARKNDFYVIAQKLIKRFYLEKGSQSHGPMHVCRTARSAMPG